MKDLLKDKDFLRSIILDNYQYPHNKQLVTGNNKYKKVHMASDSCIDDIYVQADIEDGIVKDVRFDGEGCALSTASVSIMSELVKGKSIEEANHIMDEFNKMLKGEEYDEDLLEEAVCFQNVYKQPNRIHCAQIGWLGLDKLIKGEGEDE